MASVQDLKRRIRSIRNTRKITKALQLVAGARLRRAQSRIEAMRPYADTMRELMEGVARASTSVRNLPLLQQRDVKTVAIVAVTGDRGLAGGFNAQVLRASFALERRLRGEGKDVRWLVVGRKGESTLRFRRYSVDTSFTGFVDRPDYHDAQGVAHKLIELPIAPEVLETSAEERKQDALRGDFIFEPEPEEILARLLPVYLETELYRALLESAASFLGAQMTAMSNASKNAGELVDRLTLAMNRARQAEITQEILEVVAGADALTT